MGTRTPKDGSDAAPRRVLGLVLCGGASQRMGSDKALAELGGQRLIDYAVSAQAAVADEVRLATGRTERYPELGLACVLDAELSDGSGGPLAGLVAGLEAARAEGFEVLLVGACDTPRVTPELYAALLAHRDAGDHDLTLLGTHKGGRLHPEPLIGAYHVRALEPARDALRARRLKLTAFHAGLSVGLLDEHEVATPEPARNLNTPLDLEAEEVVLRARREGASA